MIFACWSTFQGRNCSHVITLIFPKLPAVFGRIITRRLREHSYIQTKWKAAKVLLFRFRQMEEVYTSSEKEIPTTVHMSTYGYARARDFVQFAWEIYETKASKGRLVFHTFQRSNGKDSVSEHITFCHTTFRESKRIAVRIAWLRKCANRKVFFTVGLENCQIDRSMDWQCLSFFCHE